MDSLGCGFRILSAQQGQGSAVLRVLIRAEWCPGTAGAGAAALAFNLLLVYAFLAPTRSTVASIVREKELRLREGMRILGLKVRM